MWGLVLGAATALTAPLTALAGVTAADTSPPSPADLHDGLRERRGRVDELECQSSARRGTMRGSSS
ncbi:hypothetical protein HASA104033_08080 [Halobacterium salinarum]|uniref:Uncharacterized protein n=1 Tax=Halobacterium salinarum (strain ATCC 33171 / DSM 3754 / JCM 8978 / NBRC 102687 / NCIMB 764 / 91-R6) TaxID=2597657 RepID=A0A663ABK3_HALS9|nr:hypothetical protein [Halobacterium salinarum]MDL0132343.1 hypothetical protein [Halobacterium salinarum]TYO82356.1 hypothetical protein APQ99_00883 [Halobacterium salinarum DSM 3754]